MRLYKTGTNWCFWRWTITDSEYILRLHLIKTPWFAICLHWINKPDAEPYLHDHPVSFLSIILKGGYVEERTKQEHYSAPEIVLVQRNWYNYISANFTTRHRIISVKPNTLTLTFMGPKVREWGFYTENGWIHWKEYYKCQRSLK